MAKENITYKEACRLVGKLMYRFTYINNSPYQHILYNGSRIIKQNNRYYIVGNPKQIKEIIKSVRKTNTEIESLKLFD